MFASTPALCAGAEWPAAALVVRVSDTPVTVTVVLEVTTDTPGVDEVICTVHSPLAPTVVQVFGPTNEPGPEANWNVIKVPAGAFTKPVPSFTFTCPVSVWFVPTAFDAVAGVIWMLASTTA